MTEPTKHSKSGQFRIRLTIPKDLRASAKTLYGVGAELTANLKTKDKREALARAPAALAALQAKLKLVQALHLGTLTVLSQREIRAIAGDWYRDAVANNEDNPGDYAAWDAYRDGLIDAMTYPSGYGEDGQEAVYEPDAKALAEARSLLSSKGFVAHEASEEALATALWEVKTHYAALMMRRAGGDYRPDEFAKTLPLPAKTAAAERPASVSFDSILRAYCRHKGINPDAKPVDRRYYDRLQTMERLADFLGHSDAARVTQADAVQWRDSLASKANTVANDLGEMSGLWERAQKDGRVATNVFKGLAPARGKSRKSTQRNFTPEEVTQILTAARTKKGALRWLPWLLAATGARLNELCQNAKEDIFAVDGVNVFRVHDDHDDNRPPGEAQRSVKNENSLRIIPIHPKLVAEGFLDYVATLPKGSALFPDVPPDAKFGRRSIVAQKRVSAWFKEKLKITDPSISPDHSWRHWFIQTARQTDIREEVRDAITGQGDSTKVSRRYGEGYASLPHLLADAMAKIVIPVD